MQLKTWSGLLAGLALAANSYAAGFVNGGFEDGNFSNWTVGGGTRNANLTPLDPTSFLPGGSNYNATIAGHSAVVSGGQVEVSNAAVAAAMPNRVYSGTYSARVEDTTSGGYASVISQTVTNYTDSNIFFAWLAVLEGAHSAEQAAAMKLQLIDLTANNEIVISRIYSAESSGVDNRFVLLNNYYYTPTWQIEQLAIGNDRLGHDFQLIVLATDCDPTAHEGFVYLDGFGAVNPPTGTVPEPATALLFGTALLGMAALRRRRSA